MPPEYPWAGYAPALERLVIWKLLVNVQFYVRVGLDMDWALGPALRIAGYPQVYSRVFDEGIRRQACAMTAVPDVASASYVALRMPRPPREC